MVRLFIALALSLCLSSSAALAIEATDSGSVEKYPAFEEPELKKEIEITEEKPVRVSRPASLALGVGSKTPVLGAILEMNPIPYAALGIGYGYLPVGIINASFIPLYAAVYPLKSNFSPFIHAGLDFVTLKITSGNSWLNSTFQGTQFIYGAGLEYRFNFGLLARLEITRFSQAKIWIPGLSIGYSVKVF